MTLFSKLAASVTLCAMSFIALPSLANASYLCSYRTQISPDDKVNSNGQSIITGVNRASAAAIIRQDRAYYHAFNTPNFADEGDCRFASRQQRANIPRYLSAGNISNAAIRNIVNGYPYLQINIYTDRMDVNVLHDGND